MTVQILDYIEQRDRDLCAPRIEEIARQIGEPIIDVADALMTLELADRVTQVPGRGYRLTEKEKVRRAGSEPIKKESHEK